MAALFPIFLPYFFSTVALALSFQIAWRIAVFARPNFGLRAIFSYTLTILVGIGVYLVTAHWAHWWLTLLLIVFLAGMYLLLNRRLRGQKTSSSLRSLFSFYQVTWLISASLFIVSLPFLAILYQNFMVQEQGFSIAASSVTQQDYFKHDLSNMTTLVNKATQSSDLLLSIQAGPPLLTGALNDLTAANQLSFATFLSPDGTVLLRTDHPEKSGDNLFSSVNWLSTVRRNNTVYGLILNEEGIPSLVVAAEIKKNGQVLGYLLAGKYVDQDYIVNHTKGEVYPALALANGILNPTNLNPTIQSVLSSNSFNNWLSTAPLNSPVVFSFEHQLFSVTVDSIPLENSSESLKLVFIKKATSNWFTRPNPWYAF